MARREHALQIEELVKRYPTGTEALRGVSLNIEDGEFFGLLGPNGAGKSTLIHCATGLAQTTSGSIHVFGHDALDNYEEARLAIGLAPQDLNLDWFLTAAETLDYHGGYFGMPKRDRRERTAELLDAFSLTEKRDERTRTLSGGMKRRLILARALMHRPRLLILDEPTSNLDFLVEGAILEALSELCRRERTALLFVTHAVHLAQRHATHVALFRGGKVETGPAAGLLDPRNLARVYGGPPADGPGSVR